MTARLHDPGAAAVVPIDQAARDAVAHDLDANLLVDAGAGTGKTTALVRRVVSLLAAGRARLGAGADGGAPAGGIAAITFTEAAATQLRHRVRAAVEEGVRAPGGDPDGRLAAALAGLDEAPFGTLHAFAQGILAEFALEAGLPPSVEVVTGSDDRLDFEARWGGFLGALLDDPEAAPLLGRGLALGLSLHALREVAESLEANHDRAADLRHETSLPPVAVEGLVASLRKALDLREACTRPGDRLLAHLDQRVAPLLRGLESAASDDAVVALIGETPKVSCAYGTAAAWNGVKEQVTQMLGIAQRERDAEARRQQDAVARALASRLAAFVADGAAQRRRTGRLRFHDLLVLARDLVTHHPGVRAALRRRYSALLVDEFQDTDPLQLAIALQLAGDGEGLDPGRLFVVGDPKQSIYRFRRADVALYQEARRSLPFVSRSLTQNFRSVPGILGWVNVAFAALMGDGESGAPPYEPLHAQRAPLPEGDGPAVVRFGGPAGERAAAVRHAEARDVARAVRHVLDRGWRVADPRTGVLRPVRLRDIAVLVRRHATVRLLERTLEDAAIPYRLASASLVFASEEVRDLTTLLRAVADPADQVAVVAALRHPALACDDRALVDWKAAGGRWDYRRPAPPAAACGPVAAAMSRLAALHAASGSATVGGLVETVIAELRLVELAMAHDRPRDRWRRLRFLADAAHAHQDAGGHLPGFLRWVTQQSAADVRVDEYVVDEPDDDALSVSTIHGAKGLEFPVVVLLGTDTEPRRLPRHPRLLFHQDGGAELAFGGDLRTSGWSERYAEEQRLAAAEEVRLLHVGATRARDHLLVSTWHRDRSRSHAAALLALDGLEPHWAPLPLDEPTGPGEPAAHAEPHDAPPGAPTALGELRDWSAGRSERLRSAGRPRARPAPDGTSALARAVTAVLRSADPLEPSSLDGLAATAAAVEGIPGRQAEATAAARAVLGAPAVREALAGRHQRDVDVAATVDGVVVEAVADLLVEDGAGLAGVTYRPEHAPAGWEADAAAAALAVTEALGRRVTRWTTVVLRDGAAGELVLEGGDLESAVARLRAALTAP